jgi:hypothetical protein
LTELLSVVWWRCLISRVGAAADPRGHYWTHDGDRSSPGHGTFIGTTLCHFSRFSDRCVLDMATRRICAISKAAGSSASKTNQRKGAPRG